MNQADHFLLRNAKKLGWLDDAAAQRASRIMQGYELQGQNVSLARILIQHRLLTSAQIEQLTAQTSGVIPMSAELKQAGGQVVSAARLPGSAATAPGSAAIAPGMLPKVNPQQLPQQAGYRQSSPAPNPAAPAQPAQPTKAVVLGQWEVISKLGEGAMGQVYKAVSSQTGRSAAIKVLPKVRAKDNELKERFLREADTTIRMSHPNIVSGFDQGEVDGNYFYSMELLNGGSAQQYLQEHGRYTETQTLQVAMQVLKALDYASGQSLIHRDIKPDNIMLMTDGTVKLTDLGLARQTDSEETRLTMVGTTVGTPNYLSPEQARGMRDLDVRTDIYSLGISMFHMASGRLPYESQQVAKLLRAHVSEPLPDIRSISADLSAQFGKLLGFMCEKNRDNRYPSAAQVIRDVERVLRGEPPLGPDFGAKPVHAPGNAAIAKAQAKAAKEPPAPAASQSAMVTADLTIKPGDRPFTLKELQQQEPTDETKTSKWIAYVAIGVAVLAIGAFLALDHFVFHLFL
ncbi:MAG: serine/threonine-protein kinase [Planctomycetota bacterium]